MVPRVSKKSPRTPRQYISTICEQCSNDYIAFRKTSRFCSQGCRATHGNEQTDRNTRHSVLVRYSWKCFYCQKTEPDFRLFVRHDERVGEKVPLCGTHHIEVSRIVFRVRVPNAGPGYAARVNLAKRQAEEAEEIAKATSVRQK